jgi:hypothetical protein
MIVVVMLFVMVVAVAAVVFVAAPETSRHQAARNADKNEREDRSLHHLI